MIRIYDVAVIHDYASNQRFQSKQTFGGDMEFAWVEASDSAYLIGAQLFSFFTKLESLWENDRSVQGQGELDFSIFEWVLMYIYIYIYTHTYMYTRTYIYIYIH